MSSIRTHLSIIYTTKNRNTRDSCKFLHRYKHTGTGLSSSFSSALPCVLLKDVFGYSSQKTFHMNFNKNILTKCDVSLLLLLICIRYFITSGKIRSSKKHLKLATIHAVSKNKTHLTALARLSVTQSCLTLCYPMDCSPPCSPVHGILQARILEWVATSLSGGSS